MIRKIPLATNEIYHIFNKSISDFRIFNNDVEFLRMIALMQYYQIVSPIRFSDFIESQGVQKEGFNNFFEIISKNKERIVQIVAYCLMPTHIHLVIKQLSDNGISNYMRKILDSYTRYFNLSHKRKGPLCEGKFKSVLVENDEQLNHLVRYIHLNPSTTKLVHKPDYWLYSSYNEYLEQKSRNLFICQFSDLMNIRPKLYQKFVNDQISYQQELAKIKNLIMD